MLDENLSHMVLVHYRDVKGEKRKARSIKEIETAEGVQPDETTPNSEMDSFASFSFNPSNFQHSQATDGTNLISAQTSESENTESAYNHQANFGLPRLPKLQHAMAKINAGFPDTLIRTNCNEREVKEAVSSCFVPTNFQMSSQAIDTESLSGLSTSDFEDAQSACDDYRWESFFSKTVNTGFSDTTSLYSENSSCFGDDETEHSFADYFSWEALFDDHYTAGLSPWTHSRASSSVAVEPSPLGKRQRGKFSSCNITKTALIFSHSYTYFIEGDSK
ncbi:uncharacterized protein [Pyrus communis]|uniref:uncharacterized protein n=1 Tax=Pyrus communis TaxID=23211 RepID=UPI0035C0E077